MVTLVSRGCVARQEPISPGPYRSFRELSLAGSVDPGIWCPPTFVGNSGIECFNGIVASHFCVQTQSSSSWPGIAVRKDGVASLAYVPAIHVLACCSK